MRPAPALPGGACAFTIPLVTLAAYLAVSPAMAAAPPETHVFHVRVDVGYRCYGGYDPAKKVYDSRTHVPCDNERVDRTLVDRDVAIRIANEPTPDGSPTLVGDAIEQVDYKGRKFTVGLTLWKEFPGSGRPAYRLRLVGRDDEPGTRQTSYTAHGDASGRFTSVEIDCNSVGQPEEIVMKVRVEEAGRR